MTGRYKYNGNINYDARLVECLAHSQECLPQAGLCHGANWESGVPTLLLRRRLLLRRLLLKLVVWLGWGILLWWGVAAWICAWVCYWAAAEWVCYW